MLHCSTCRQKLTAYQEGTLDPASRAQVEAHLRECPDCARELRREAAIREALHSIESQPAPAELRSRVRSAIEAERTRKSALSWTSLFGSLGLKSSGLTWAGGVTAAACALLLIVRLNPELAESRIPVPAAENAPASSVVTEQAAPQHQPSDTANSPVSRKLASKSRVAPIASSAPAHPVHQPASSPAAPPRIAGHTTEASSPARKPVAAPAKLPHADVRRTRTVPPPAVLHPSPLLARGDGHKPAQSPAQPPVSPSSARHRASTGPHSVAKMPGEAPLPPDLVPSPPHPMAATVMETPAATTPAVPENFFTASATWDNAAEPTPGGVGPRVTIKARPGAARAAASGTDGANGLAPVTNVAPLAPAPGEDNTLIARGNFGGGRNAASATMNGASTPETASNDSRQPANFALADRRLNLVIVPNQDVTGARVRLQVPANAVTHTSAFEAIIWEGDVRKGEPIRVPWSPPASLGDLPPFTVILETVGADERARALQTQLVVVPSQSGAATK